MEHFVIIEKDHELEDSNITAVFEDGSILCATDTVLEACSICVEKGYIPIISEELKSELEQA